MRVAKKGAAKKMNPYLASALLIAGSWIIGYLLGSIPTGVIIGKVFFHKDPRDYFSHNSGGTNVGRVFGRKIGILVIFLDALKALIAVYLSFFVICYTPLAGNFAWFEGAYDATPIAYWGAGLFAIIGHCRSIFLKFQGGKAVASYVGVSLASGWFFPVTMALTFFPIAIKKSIVSISSLMMSAVSMLVAWVIAIINLIVPFNTQIFTWSFGFGGAPVLGVEYAVVATIITIIIFVRHIPNIKRLLEGSENKA